MELLGYDERVVEHALLHARIGLRQYKYRSGYESYYVGAFDEASFDVVVS